MCRFLFRLESFQQKRPVGKIFLNAFEEYNVRAQEGETEENLFERRAHDIVLAACTDDSRVSTKLRGSYKHGLVTLLHSKQKPKFQRR